jgi:hypothetical protein
MEAQGGVSMVSPEAVAGSVTPEQLEMAEAVLMSAQQRGRITEEDLTKIAKLVNQDVVRAPATRSEKLTLAEKRAIRREDVSSSIAGPRSWYKFWEVDFTNPNDLSALIAGVALGIITITIIGGIIYAIRND